MLICIISVILANTLSGAVDVRAKAPLPRATLLELQSGWVPEAERPQEIEVPAALLRSERSSDRNRVAAVVSDDGQISEDGDVSIEELLKDEVVKQQKNAQDMLNIPKVVACAGTELGAVPHGFTFPENYPTDPAWTVKSIWNSNKAGLYGAEVTDARYVAVTLAEQQPSGGYYYLVFGDELSEIGTKLKLPMSDCNFGDALGKFLKTGARPDSEARTLGNATVTWNGTTWLVYENPVPREVPQQTERTLFEPMEFPSLDALPPKDSKVAAQNHSADGNVTASPQASNQATTTSKATLHSAVDEIKETLQGLKEEIQELKVAGAAVRPKSAGIRVTFGSRDSSDDNISSKRADEDSSGDNTSSNGDEDVVDIKDLYLAGRLLPKNGHFQIHGDGTSSFQKDGVNLRLDPGTSKSPLGGDNDLVVNLAGYSCSKFFGSLRITKERPPGARGITFFAFQDEKSIGSILVGGTAKKDFPFQYGLDPDVSNISIRVHDHGTPDKDFFEVEGYLSCKVDCEGRAMDTDTGSCESLTNDAVRCQGAADPHGRPCQWNSGRCFSIESGRCSRETLCYQVLDGTSDCGGRSDYDSCTQRSDGSGTLCGWKDKDQKCFTSTFNCKASHGKHNKEVGP